MKQIIYILLTTTMLGLMSCSDWLDVSPKTSIPTDKQFESESGFKDALTGIYLKLGTTTLYAGDLTYACLLYTSIGPCLPILSVKEVRHKMNRDIISAWRLLLLPIGNSSPHSIYFLFRGKNTE